MGAGSATTSDVHAARVRRDIRDRAIALNLYIGAVGLCALVLGYLFWYLQARWDVLPPLSVLGPSYSVPGAFFFVLVGLLADRFRVTIRENVEISAGFLADFLSAALLGPVVGAMVASASLLTGGHRTSWMRTVFNVSSFWVVGGTTGVVYWAFQALFESPGIAIVVGGLVAGCTYFVMNFFLYYPVMHLRGGIGLAQWFNEAFRPYLPFYLFFLTLSLGLIYSFDQMGPPGFVLFFLPVMGLVYAFRTFTRQRELTRSLERFSLQIAASMITALDLKDNYTAQHSAAVAQYAYDTAHALGMNQKQCSVAHLAGLLHDLGKISVPDEILNSRERLSEDEWLVIQGHTSAGQSIVGNMDEFEELGNIIRHHHERYDGSGYPDGLTSESIPQISRIVAVADSYSAMVSERPYSRRRRPDEAIGELKSMAGTQFDPRVVGAFLRVLETATPEYRMAEQLDFRLQFQKARFLGEIA